MPRRRAALAACLLALAAPSAAAANTYNVPTPAADAVGLSCSTVVSGQATCPNLRAAITAANNNTGGDAITLGAGTFPLNQGQLTISGDLTLTGIGARNTIIAPSNQRAFVVSSGNVAISLVTISGGSAVQVTGDGGNILNSANLTLNFVRLTAGSANRGGGIANEAGGTQATLTLFQSLIDHNTASVSGAGIANVGQTAASALSLTSSTVAFNGTAGGISSEVNASVVLTESTVARNTGAGLAVSAGSVQAKGSIVADNTTNCSGTAPQDLGGNIEEASTCKFSGSGKDPLLNAALVTDGGQTDVLALPANSPAVDFAGACTVTVDQRSVARPQGPACDSGAYEYVPPAPPPTPTPTPTPTPAPTPTPTPVPGKTVVGAAVSGKVLVKTPGSKSFVAVGAAQGIPLGSTVDTTHGTVQITAKPGQVAEFFDGLFKITQTKTTTDLTLNQPLACSTSKTARAAAKKPRTRKLWGSGSGSFRTRGQYSSATVRGTEWLVQDTCTATLTRVKHGVVSVRDEVKHKTVILRAPHRYTARAKKKR